EHALDELIVAKIDLLPQGIPNARSSAARLHERNVRTSGASTILGELTEHGVHGQPGRGRYQSGCRPITAPAPSPWHLGQAGSYRIEHDVTSDLEQVGVAIDQNGVITPLEYVSGPQMATVEALSVNAIQLPHAVRQVRLRGFDEQVIVIAHQTVSVTPPTQVSDDFLENLQ